jgi:hypothetical protein
MAATTIGRRFFEQRPTLGHRKPGTQSEFLFAQHKPQWTIGDKSPYHQQQF